MFDEYDKERKKKTQNEKKSEIFWKLKRWNRAADRQTGVVLQKELSSDTWHQRKKAWSYWVIKTIKSEMDIDIDKKDIDQSNQIGAKTENVCWHIVVKFLMCLERCKVFNRNKRLKSKTTPITESFLFLSIFFLYIYIYTFISISLLKAWQNYDRWFNGDLNREIDMVFEIYGHSMERS